MKYLILTIILVFCFECEAQITKDSIIINNTVEFKVDRRAIPTNFIGYHNQFYYLLYGQGKYGDGQKSIKKFNSDLTPTNFELELFNEQNEESSSFDVIQIDTLVYNITKSKGENVRRFYLQKANYKQFTKSQNKLLFEIHDKEQNLNRSYQTFLTSNDNSKIAFFYTIPDKKTNEELIGVKIFNKNFEIISQNEYKISTEKNNIYFHTILLKNNSEIILLLENNLKKDKDTKSSNNNKSYYYDIISLFKGNQREIKRIFPEDKHLRQIELLSCDNNDLIITGFFSEESIYSIKGTYYLRIDYETSEIKSKTLNEFEIPFFIRLLNGNARKRKIENIKNFHKGNYEDKSYILKSVFQLENEEILLVAEKTYEVSNIVYGVSVSMMHYEDIAIIKLNKNGEIAWANKIGKDNSTIKSTTYSSYIAIKHKSNVYLIYNDNKKNLNHTVGLTKKAFSTGGPVLIAVKILKNGTYKRILLKDKVNQNDIVIRPRLGRWIDNNTFLLFGQNSNDVQKQGFIKIKFQD